MDESKFLILHYSTKRQEWYDATPFVTYLEVGKNSWLVRFKSSDRILHVSFVKMKVFGSPEVIPFAQIYYKGKHVSEVKKLICFQKKIYKLFYESGYTRYVFPDEIKVVQDVLKNDEKASGVMAYYKTVVHETSALEDNDFLISQFDDIDYVNEDSILSMYLKGQLSKSESRFVTPVVCPFGLNMSQSKALKMAFENRISIIEGPPGTGKTQTILNIISNAIIRGKSVAVVSNNNAATDNVFEKLDHYGYSFICAPLGNAENVTKFFEEYDSKIPTMEKKEVNVYKLNSLYIGLPRYFLKENEKKQLISSLSDLELEHKHFLSDHKDFNFNDFSFRKKNLSPETIQNALIRLQEKEKLGLFEQWILKLRFKVRSKAFTMDKDTGILLLQNQYYLAKKRQIEQKIKVIEDYMKGETLEKKVNTFKELSNIYFRNRLIDLYAENKRDRYDKRNYKRKFSDFVKDYPVVLSSTYALAKCSQKGFLFDYLIIDESSQVNMASAIISMRMARNMIVVGDIKQLPQIDNDSFRERNKELLKKFKVSKAYSYQGNSIMSSLLTLYGNRIPTQILREHYRCAPEIIGFCNQEFYDKELIIYTKPRKNNTLSMEVIKTVPGNFARKNPTGPGLYNQREIDEIDGLLQKEKLDDIGVITPYHYQAELIQERFQGKVEASTIHKFQGREKKTIIFSSVVNDVNDFVGNDNLINVAVSRAEDKFILVTSDKVFHSKTGVLSDLVNYISYHSDFGRVDEGSVRSIYDILYHDYEEQLKQFREKHPSEDYDSETLTKELLKNILNDKQYKNLSFRMHVSLRDFIIADNLDFTEEEEKFYNNPHSHADFLLFNKMSKKPLCVIEVDGVSFHEQIQKQRERDRKKDSILQKAGIPLLRLKTNESQEKERITLFLNQLLNK